MVEATTAEPGDSAGPTIRRPRRKHTINLCCAHSVEDVVGQVALHLRDLGFTVNVVCGAQARAALLGSRAKADEPTIHVVCVEGSLQERVLKPLRQALAAHGGPHAHLFVAVLDLDVPLAMVGQIRRFADALERPPSRRAAVQPASEVARTAAHRPLPSSAEEAPAAARRNTRANRTVDAADRPRRRSRNRSARRRAAKIGPTAKHRAITATHAVVPQAEAGVRKRRRGRSRASAAADASRVLGLPNADPQRPDGKGPPPPPPGGLKRRSSTTLPAVGDGPPPAPVSDDRVRPYERDGYRFTPPAVKAAEIRAKSEPHAIVPGTGSATATEVVRSGMYPTIGGRTPRDEAADSEQRANVSRKRNKGGMYPIVPFATAAEQAALDGTDGGDDDAALTGAAEGSASPTTEAKPTPKVEEARDVPAEPVLAARSAGDTKPDPLVPSSDPHDRSQAAAPAETNKEPTTRYGLDELATDIAAVEASETAKTVMFMERPAEPEPEPAAPPTDEGDAADEESRATVMFEPAPARTTLLLDDAPAVATPDHADPDEDDELESADRTNLYREPAKAEQPQPDLDDAPTIPPAGRGSRTVIAVHEPSPPPEAVESKTTVVPTALPAEAETETETETETEVDAPTPASPADSDVAVRIPATTPAVEPPRSATHTIATPKPAPVSEEKRRSLWPWLVLLLLVGLGVAAYLGGYLDGLLGRADAPTTVAGANTKTPPAAGNADPPSEPAEPSHAVEPSHAAIDASPAADDAIAEDGEAAIEASADSTGAGSEGTGDTGGTEAAEPAAGSGGEQGTGAAPDGDSTGTTEAPEPANEDDGDTAVANDPAATTSDDPGTDTPAPVDDPGKAEGEPTRLVDTPGLTAEEKVLAKAADEHRLVMLKTLFASRRQGAATTWKGGMKRCSDFEIDGIRGWRLPHRREMKLINAVVRLSSGVYWTYTVPKDDRNAAYVLDTQTGGLSLFLKHEPTGEVLCVRRRANPGK